MPEKYTLKATEVEAHQYVGDRPDNAAVEAWAQSHGVMDFSYDMTMDGWPYLAITNPEGVRTVVRIDDWLVWEDGVGFSSMSDSEFKKRYITPGPFHVNPELKKYLSSERL